MLEMNLSWCFTIRGRYY